jgi:crotonobetainyl-CoA:carnitine CoA-transferase CaiB-like acyl-CoA transferase
MSRRQPLRGVRVLDLSAYWAGPLAARLFADLGADVIKVESVQRIDGWRGTFTPTNEGSQHELSPAHNSINVNKRGITLNLTSAAGVALCKRLVAICDVLIENYSPRVMAQFGLDWPVLRELNPRLVMVSLAGFGASGPWRDYVSYAATVECTAGVAALTGYVEGPPQMQGASIGDPLGGSNGAVAALMALYRARRTGRGCWVDLSQIEGVTALLGDQLLDYTINGRVPPRHANAHPAMAPHGVYPCADSAGEDTPPDPGPGSSAPESVADQADRGFGGSAPASVADRGSGQRPERASQTLDDQWLALAVETEAQWRALCGVLGQPQVSDDPRFATLLARREHAAELDAIVTAWTRTRDKYAAMRELLAAGVPAGAVQSNLETLIDPQLRARDFFQELDRAWVGRHPHTGMGITLDGTPPQLRRPAPTLGQHNAEVLSDMLGISETEIDELTAGHVIGDEPVWES